MTTTYALIDVEGNVTETTAPKKDKGHVTMKGGRYHVARRFIRERTKWVFFGLVPIKDKIIYFLEPFKEPFKFYEPTPELKAAMEEDSAWADRTAWEAREMEGMYEKKVSEFPIAWVICIFLVIAVIILAVKVVH